MLKVEMESEHVWSLVFFLAGRGNPRLTPELKRNVVSPFRFSTDGTNGFNMTSSTRFGKKSKVFPGLETRYMGP